MNRFDLEEFTTKFIGITQENFRPIYLPMFLSIIVFIMGVIVFLLTDNTELFKIAFGLSGIVLASSGIGQVKLKEVPGFPFLRGGCAVMFGIFFLLLFMLLGIGVIFFE